MRSLQDDDGWIDLETILNFNKMTEFRSLEQRLHDELQDSPVVETRRTLKILFNQVTNLTKVQVRKRELEFNYHVTNIVGYDIEKLKYISKKEFEKFQKKKTNYQRKIIKEKQIIVTTVGCAAN